MVSEFVIPFTDETYEGDVQAKPSAKSGDSIYLGVLVDDNDMPGADVQNLIPWPSTYGTFNSKESGALATFE